MERSPLARLPPELRNRIYECMVEDNKPIVLFVRKINGVRKARKHHRRRHGSIGLLYTCKQLHMEFLPIFYGRNTSEVIGYCSNAARRLRDFIGNTSSSRNMLLLRHLEVSICDPEIDPVDKKVVKKFRKILYDIRRHGQELPKCEIRVVLALGDPSLEHGLALNPKTPLHMERSVADCIKQLSAALKSIQAEENGRGGSSGSFWGYEPETWAYGEGIPDFLRAVRDGMVYD